MKGENKTLKYLLNLDLVIASLALIVLVFITFTGVIMRYFLNNPFVWLEEAQLWCFVWVVFFGGGAAFRTGSHVAIEVLVDLMPNSVKKFMDIFIYIVVMFVLLYFMNHGTNLVKQLATTGRNTNILKIPYPLIYSAFPIGCVLMMINYTIMTAASMFIKNTEIKAGE